MPIFALLLTACIKPSFSASEFSLKRSDPAIRLRDYEGALDFWLRYPAPEIKKILFVENSGADLSSLRRLVSMQNVFNREIEFIQFIAKPVPSGLHYGYSELEMIDKAVLESTILSPSDFIIKVTGRLYFPKLAHLLKSFKKEYQFMSDSRDFKLFSTEHRYIVTTLFISSVEFYKKILLYKKDLMSPKKNFMIENLYFDILKPLHLESTDTYILRFPFNVDPVGVGAHANVNYTSVRKRIPGMLRNVCRRLLPNVWI